MSDTAPEMDVPAAVSRADFDDVMVPTYAPADRVPVSGQGSRVWDQQGRDYVDFAGGIAVTALGHAHPALVAALQEQSKKLWHVSNLLTNEPALRLAHKLCSATFAERVYFANSGAEANEAALKLARKYAADHYGADNKNRIVSFKGSFHGRTLFSLSAGGQSDKASGFEPLVPNIDHVAYNDIDALEATMDHDVCAIIVEPIQGEGGVIPADEHFLQRARDLADRHGALLIFDEVQSGVGRSGHLYAYRGYGVTPDVLTSAKGLGGGFPVAAMLTMADIAASLGVGSHGSTYGGNPLACAVGEAVIDTVNTPEVLHGVQARSDHLRDALSELGQRFGVFENVRGHGLLIGCVLTPAWQGHAKRLLNAALERGLLVLVAGPDVIRIAPSLVIPQADIEDGLTRFEKALSDVTSEPKISDCHRT